MTPLEAAIIWARGYAKQQFNEEARAVLVKSCSETPCNPTEIAFNILLKHIDYLEDLYFNFDPYNGE